MGVMIVATSILFGTKLGKPLAIAALVGTRMPMALGLTAFLMSPLLSVVAGQFQLPGTS